MTSLSYPPSRAAGFDLTGHLRSLCARLVQDLPELSHIRVEISRDKGRTFAKDGNEMVKLAPRIRVVNAGLDDPEELPFP